MTITGRQLTALALLVILVWTFVSAPPPLPDSHKAQGPSTASVPIQKVLQTIAAENDVVRSLYTQSIVGAGKTTGLKFSEDWKHPDVEAGPLPAVYLRTAAESLNHSPVPLGLFLGSHRPITASNHFSGTQKLHFENILKSRAAEFFFDESTERWTAMFPDFATVDACINCHNGHPDSPKHDWKLGDIMGATTWNYPKATVTVAEYMNIISAVRTGFRTAYKKYLTKVKSFDRKPEIGKRWPEQGFALPDADTFMTEFERRASRRTLEHLLN
ncbi:MAG: DUF3365 domain-containing protein [Fuerstiella sp.]|nr:DUF3365 domain-containing protein [Fuerstiella sp.]